jgi:hypothetical protein
MDHLFITSKCWRVRQGTLGSSGHSQAARKLWAKPEDSINANDPNVWPNTAKPIFAGDTNEWPRPGGADELRTEGRDLAPSQGNFARLPWLRTFPVMS